MAEPSGRGKSLAHPRVSNTLGDADASIGDDALAGNEGARVGREEYRYPSYVARLAEAPERRRFDALRAPLVVLPQRARELGLHQPGRDGVDPHAPRAPLGGEVAHQMMVGGLGNAVRADHRV